MAGERIDIPIVIGGREIRTGRTQQAVMPHNHQHVLADWHAADPEHVHEAIAASKAAAREWSSWRWEDRAAVFLRAAELLTTTWRQTFNAATMLGQSKTAFQAEIDSASELIDFWRFNAYFAQELYAEQPFSSHGVRNRMDYRPLEGFVYAVTPFNFTAIAGNLPTAPALMGNTVIWKPASSAMLSGYYIMRLLERAGLPPGVINFVPGDAAQITNIAAGLTRSRGHSFHRQHGGVQQHVARRSARTSAATVRIRASSVKPAARISSSRTRRPTRRRWRSPLRAARFEYPGAEVFGREPHLHSAVALARRTRPSGRHDARDEDGRRRGLPYVHRCGDRPKGVRKDQRAISRMRRRTQR